MDYIKTHHMWKPLAAISAREEMRTNLVTVPSPFLKSTTHSAFHKKITNAITTEILPVSHVTTSLTNNEVDVWHKIIFETDSNSILNRINETDTNVTGILYNATMAYGNYSLSNETYSNEVAWQLVTMIGTAVALGLLILATVIGEFDVLIFPLTFEFHLNK